MRWNNLSVVTFVLIGSSAIGQEWTRFRGPNGTGVSDSKTIPVSWTDEDYNWQSEIPGLGHSSPVVWGQKLFVLSADPEDATRFVLAYDTDTGKKLWQRDYNSDVHHLHTRSSFASSTPAVDDEFVYYAWSTPDATTLKAFTHAGEEIWSKDLGRWVSQHGFGTSPIIYKDMVILHNSQQASQLEADEEPGESFMMAFARDTGEEIWRTPLVSKNVCYSVPFIYEPAGRRPELVCTSTGNGVFSLDPETGKVNWSFDDAFVMRTVGSPILAGGHIFGSTGSGRYSGNYVIAVKPGKSASLGFKLQNSGSFKAPYVPSLIARDNHVYMLYDRGFASCVNAETGDVLWSERTRAAYSGSPVMVDGKIYCVDEDGVVWVIAAEPNEYRLLAKNTLGEASRSTPAVANGRMYLRTESHLFSIGGSK